MIDTPSVLGSAEVNLIEEQSDGIVMIVRSGKTRAREIRAALDQLSSNKMLGFVMLDE